MPIKSQNQKRSDQRGLRAKPRAGAAKRTHIKKKVHSRIFVKPTTAKHTLKAKE